MERHPMLMDQRNQYCENGYTTKSHFGSIVQCHLHQNSNEVLHRDRKLSPKVYMEEQNILNSQSNSEQKEQCWRYHNP
jgi:hypothetical protein